MERWWNDTDWENEVLGEQCVAVRLCPPYIPQGLVWDRIQAYAVRGW